MPFWGDTIQPSTGDISGCPCLVAVLSHQKKKHGAAAAIVYAKQSLPSYLHLFSQHAFTRAGHLLGTRDNKVTGKPPAPGSAQTGEEHRRTRKHGWACARAEEAPPLQGRP